jgi:uncharacterized protein (TIGR03437 family)
VVPYGITDSTVDVQAEYRDQRTNTITLPVASESPAIFTVNATGTGQGLIVNPDGTLNGPGNPPEVVSLCSTALAKDKPTPPE